MIHCEIRTPQYAEVVYYIQQKGYLDTNTMIFEPEKGQPKGHTVHFHTMDCFLEHLVREIKIEA